MLRSIAVSAAQVATGFEDGLVEISTRSLGEHVRTLVLPRAVSALAFSPDGRTLATAAYDFFALWPLDDPPAAFRPLPWLGRPRALAFSPDGKWIAASVDHGGVWINEVSTGAPVRWFGEHSVDYGRVMEQQSDFESRSAMIMSLAFSPSGRRLAVASEGGLYIHDFDEETTARSLSDALAFVAYTSESDIFWSAEGGTPNALGLAIPSCSALALAPDRSTLFLGMHDGSVHTVRLF